MIYMRTAALCTRHTTCGLSGQTSVEAAFLIPILLGGVLLLVQPGIILYDRTVMQAAAAEACRLLATSNDTSEGGLCDSYIKRRLGAIPPHDLFHVHKEGCTWEIALEGNEATNEVSVTISTALRPLPLIDFAGKTLGFVDETGYIYITVSASMPTQPTWITNNSTQSSPTEWVGSWLQ